MRRIAPVLAAVALVACGREANDDIAPEPLEPATAEIPSGTVDADNLPPPVISATPPEIAEDYRAPMRLTGTEPFWGVTIGDTILLQRPDHPDLTATNAGPTINGEVAMWNAREFTIRLSPGVCSDGMSDNRYPYAATVTVKGEVLKGCAARADQWPKGGG